MEDDKAIFDEVPYTTQNPLLGIGDFYRFVAKRLNKFRFEDDFSEWLQNLEDAKHILPAFIHESITFYSTFQIWQVYHFLHHPNDQIDSQNYYVDFRKILELLIAIQDFYLPEIRSNQRTGEVHDYGGQVAVSGTYMNSKSEYVLSGIRNWHAEDISSGNLNPSELLQNSGLSIENVIRWIQRIESEAKNIDPIPDLRLLLRYVPHSRRELLRFDALLAGDFFEIVQILARFLMDHILYDDSSSLKEQGEFLSYKVHAGIHQTQLQRYETALNEPFQMLEYLTNSFTLNPKPRAIIFTEGEEWRAIESLYNSYGFDTKLLGIELRSIYGAGQFSFTNWRFFIEYMHEKQVLIYFVLDSEGRVSTQAKRLLESKRMFQIDDLEKVVPSQDRICIWDNSFEEANFMDVEISQALAMQQVALSEEQIRVVRNDTKRGKKGLINALKDTYNSQIDKPRLAIDLAKILIKQRQNANIEETELRRVEKFIQASGELIALNHQPSTPELRQKNFRTGLLG